MSMHTVTDGDRTLLSGCSFILIPLGLIILAFFLLRPILQPMFDTRKNTPPSPSERSSSPPETAEPLPPASLPAPQGTAP